jgi:hypothetical protein
MSYYVPVNRRTGRRDVRQDYCCPVPHCDRVLYDRGYAPQCPSHPHIRMKPTKG